MSYLDKLINFMNSINPNVNWNNVMNELMNRPIEKIFSKLKTYLWTDKGLIYVAKMNKKGEVELL